MRCWKLISSSDKTVWSAICWVWSESPWLNWEMGLKISIFSCSLPCSCLGAWCRRDYVRFRAGLFGQPNPWSARIIPTDIAWQNQAMMFSSTWVPLQSTHPVTLFIWGEWKRVATPSMVFSLTKLPGLQGIHQQSAQHLHFTMNSCTFSPGNLYYHGFQWPMFLE